MLNTWFDFIYLLMLQTILVSVKITRLAFLKFQFSALGEYLKICEFFFCSHDLQSRTKYLEATRDFELLASSQLWWETQPSEPRLPIFIIRFKKVLKKPSKSCRCLGWALRIQILFKQRTLEFTVQPMANGGSTVQQDSRSQETDQFYDFFLHKQSLWPLSKW